MGDLNKDGLDDIAIGAPADLSPNAGKVYIYMGSRRRHSIIDVPRPAQVLSPISMDLPLSKPVFGFGLSVSGGADFDNTNSPDFVVGAPYSDVAFLFRYKLNQGNESILHP